MANRKISDLTALTAPVTGDLLPIVDISEAAAADKNKKITYGTFLSSVPLGTAAAPSIAFTGDTNTGIYSPGADQLAVATNGVQRINIEADGDINIDGGGVFYDATNNRLAIGTTSPSNQAHIYRTDSGTSNGALRLDGNGSYAGVQFAVSGTNYGSICSDTSSFYITHASNISFRTGGSGNVGGTDRASIDSSGRLLVGTSTSRNGGYADPAQVLIEGLNYNAAAQSIILNSNDGNGASLNFGKSRGTSLNSNTIVQNGDFLGVIDFAGADGSGMKRGAVISAEVDGTPGANDMPGRLVFSTTADGAASPIEALRISNDRSITVSDGGHVVLGTTTGTKIGTATTQKIGFYNATPVVQPAAVADATDAASVIARLNDLLARLRTLGIIAT